MTRSILRIVSALSLVALLSDCVEPEVPKPTRDPRTQKWLTRARASYRLVDIEDASDALEEALRASPNDPEVRMAAAQVALAKLDFTNALKLSERIDTAEAHAVRGRAFWYSGEVEAAGKELQQLLRDPDTHDNWAKNVLQLTNRGVGRKPYAATGSIVAATEMPRIRNTAMVIPVEIDGEQGLAMLASGTAEVMLDSSQRREPSWISLRIAGRVEFHDVPALTQDLSGVARQLGIPSLKALLGVNFLRHANVTIDFLAQQFVVRRFQPPRPPNATDVPLAYIKGGGMTFRSALRAENPQLAALIVDTSMAFPLALDPQGWRKAGVDPETLKAVPGEPKLKEGVVPLIKLGTFDVPQVAGVSGVDLSNMEEMLGVDLDGVVGSGLLGGFRVTLADGGRMMWIEEEMASEPTPAPATSGGPAPGAVEPAPPLAPQPGGTGITPLRLGPPQEHPDKPREKPKGPR